ncbi:hypothetical protein JRQ81_013067, partial [Phrynocephalus forsythii]
HHRALEPWSSIPRLEKRTKAAILHGSWSCQEISFQPPPLLKEPPRTEMYSLHCPKAPPTPSLSNGGQRLSCLHWEREGGCKAMTGPCQKKPEEAPQPLLDARTGEDQLANGEERSGQARDLLGEKERMDSSHWRLDFESQSVHEEIYWGCFYFFPWLRMCKKDKKDQPS